MTKETTPFGIEDIKKISRLEDRLRELTTDFQQTREMFRVPCNPYNRGGDYKGKSVSFDLKDMNVLGGIRNSGILLTGKSGGGKTHLSKMAMNAFFGGDNYCNRTVTPGMNEEAFLDIDFGKIKDGATLKEAIKSTPILNYPGVILNEVNRAPSIIQNILIPYLEFEFNIKGLDFDVGIPINGSGGRYQFRILTINEGGEYKGIASMDKAVRDRMPIEIPIDNFKSLKKDIRDMINKRKSSAITVNKNKEPLTDVVLELYSSINNIEVSAMAREFLVYLSGLSNCIKSNTGSKEGIIFNLELCRGCTHASTDNNLCGNVYSPTNRSIINLETIAKGVAAIRAYKTLVNEIEGSEEESKKRRALNKFAESEYLANLQVECQDLLAIAPFILYSKIQINDQWIHKHYQGNRFLAIQDVVEKAYGKFSSFYKDHKEEIVKYRGKDEEMTKFLKKYAEEKDAWMYNIKDFENEAPSHSDKIGLLISEYKSG